MEGKGVENLEIRSLGMTGQDVLDRMERISHRVRELAGSSMALGPDKFREPTYASLNRLLAYAKGGILRVNSSRYCEESGIFSVIFYLLPEEPFPRSVNIRLEGLYLDDFGTSEEKCSRTLLKKCISWALRTRNERIRELNEEMAGRRLEAEDLSREVRDIRRDFSFLEGDGAIPGEE